LLEKMKDLLLEVDESAKAKPLVEGPNLLQTLIQTKSLIPGPYMEYSKILAQVGGKLSNVVLVESNLSLVEYKPLTPIDEAVGLSSDFVEDTTTIKYRPEIKVSPTIKDFIKNYSALDKDKKFLVEKTGTLYRFLTPWIGAPNLFSVSLHPSFRIERYNQILNEAILAKVSTPHEPVEMTAEIVAKIKKIKPVLRGMFIHQFEKTKTIKLGKKDLDLLSQKIKNILEYKHPKMIQSLKANLLYLINDIEDYLKTAEASSTSEVDEVTEYVFKTYFNNSTSIFNKLFNLKKYIRV